MKLFHSLLNQAFSAYPGSEVASTSLSWDLANAENSVVVGKSLSNCSIRIDRISSSFSSSTLIPSLSNIYWPANVISISSSKRSLVTKRPPASLNPNNHKACLSDVLLWGVTIIISLLSIVTPSIIVSSFFARSITLLLG